MVKIDFNLSLEYEVLSQDGADFVFNIHAANTERQRVSDERLVINQNVVSEVATDSVRDLAHSLRNLLRRHNPLEHARFYLSGRSFRTTIRLPTGEHNGRAPRPHLASRLQQQGKPNQDTGAVRSSTNGRTGFGLCPRVNGLRAV
jgi:hypothetical protein